MTLQVADVESLPNRSHVLPVNPPVVESVMNDTVPVGTVGLPATSITVAVQVLVDPMTTGLGVQEIVVVVGFNAVIATLPDPPLDSWVASSGR